MKKRLQKKIVRRWLLGDQELSEQQRDVCRVFAIRCIRRRLSKRRPKAERMPLPATPFTIEGIVCIYGRAIPL